MMSKCANVASTDCHNSVTCLSPSAWRMILTVDCGMFCETIKAFRFNGAVTQLSGRQLQFVSVKRS